MWSAAILRKSARRGLIFAAVVAAWALIAGVGGGRQATGHPSAGDGVATGVCPLAAPTRHLPARSGCVTVRRADVDGDGRRDVVIVYSRLSRQHPSGYVGAVPPGLRSEFMASAAFLKVVLANGTAVSTRIRGTRAAALDAVAHVGEDPGKEILLEIERISSGEEAVAYGLDGGRLVPAGVTLSYGGDSATKAGFDCLPGNPPQLIQRAYELIGPTIDGWWRETDTVYAWHGPKLVRVSMRTFKRHGAVRSRDERIGHGCIAGVG
jgi:hypothetical protein